MPNHKTHDRAAYIATPVITVSMLLYFSPIVTLVVVVSFLVGNHWLSPDLDIVSIMRKRWSILYVVWYPYQRLIHHRSVLSHSGPLSAALRLLYLSLWFIIPAVLFVSVDVVLQHLQHYYVFYALFYIGVALADTLHTTLDYLF